MRNQCIAAAVAGCCLGVGALGQVRAPSSWPTLAGSPQRTTILPVNPPSIKTPRWIATEDDQNQPIVFNAQSGVVATVTRVYATGASGGASRAYSFDARDGRCVWSSIVPEPWFDSWSTPLVDEEHLRLLIASGDRLSALDLFTGAIEWETPLARPVVNASPLITRDLGPADRAFITDFDGFGQGASLYCINVDTYNSVLNPYQPGEIVWTAPIGRSSGNSPAYEDGRVYVATADGFVIAYDAAATTPPSPEWVASNPGGIGFFGGVSVAQNAVFAASYNFSGGLQSANLLKIDRKTGSVVWSTPCNRTASIPTVYDDGRIVLSGGVRGFGSLPTIEYFQDNGATVTPLWNSALATWKDLNQNGVIDPGEYLEVGGWTHHAVATRMSPHRRLLCGVLSDGAFFDPYKALLILDLEAGPTGSFVIESFQGAGSTPAMSGGGVYTIGQGGLYAFGPPCFADCDGDGKLTLFDFLCFSNAFLAGDPFADCDGDGLFTMFDFLCYQNAYQVGCPKGGA